MAYQQLTIPLVRGMDESVAEQVRSHERLKDVINGRYVKQGEIEKRPGFTTISNGVEESSAGLAATANGDVRGMFSTGDELCVIGGRRLYAYNPTHGYWYDRGAVSPFTGRLTRTFYGEPTYESADCAYQTDSNGGGFWLYAAQLRSEYTNSGGADVPEWRLQIVGKSSDGAAAVGSKTLLTANLTSDRPHAIRCVASGDGSSNYIFVFAAIDGDTGGGTPSVIRCWRYNVDNPHNTPTVLASSWKSNVYYAGFSAGTDEWNNFRAYDAVKLSSGDQFLFVWIDETSRDIDLAVHDHDTSGTAATSHTETENVRAIACCDDDALDRVYVAVWSVADGEGGAFPAVGNELRLYGFVKSTLAKSFGPITLHTLGSAEEPGRTLGVAKGTNSSGVGRVVVTYSIHQDSATGNVASMRAWTLYTRSTTTTGSSLSTARKLHNVVPTSRPFYHRSRWYVAATSHNAKHAAFGYSAVYDLMESEDETPRLAAIYDVGTAPCLGQYAYGALLSGPLRKGSCNSVIRRGSTNAYTFMSISQSEAHTNSDRKPRCGADEVTLDFDGVVTADSTIDGAAVIGGGYVALYDGYETVELGFPTPPVLVELDEVAGSGGPDASTYYAIGVWHYFMPSGMLHRSMPSPAESVTVTSDGNLISYAAFSYPGSHKSYENVNAVFFRSSEQTSNFRRVQKPTHVTPNSESQDQTTIHHEADPTPLGPFLYTQGGTIESVAPEGAAIVRAGIDRLWLGDFFRRDRVQFSKPYLPGTATEHALAPEFNEGFTRLVPDGSRLRAMVELDDRFVIFTEDSVFWIAGDGPDDRGGGSDYPPLTLVTTDTGCIEPRSIVNTPDGIMFQGRRGIYTLTRNIDLKFTGFAVVDRLAATPVIVSASLSAKDNEVYFACRNEASTDGQILVYNYAFGAWSRWVIRDDDGGDAVVPSAACVHQGEYYVIGSGASPATVYKADSTTHMDTLRYVTMTVETGWFTAGNSAAWKRIRRVMPMMKRVDGHDLTVELYTNFGETPLRTSTFDGSRVATFPESSYNPQVASPRPKCHAFKVKVYDSDDLLTSLGNHGGYTISAVTLEWAPKRGNSRVPGTQSV